MKAVSNFDYDIKAIMDYYLPLIEFEDRENIFKHNYEDWYNLVFLLIEGLKMFSDTDRKFDFNKMFEDLTGKIPYKGRRKKIEYTGGKMIFSIFYDVMNDYMFNLKIDPIRKRLIMKTMKKYRNASIKVLQKYYKK